MFFGPRLEFQADVEMASRDESLNMLVATQGSISDCGAGFGMQRRRREEASCKESEKVGSLYFVSGWESSIPDTSAVSMRDYFEETDCFTRLSDTRIIRM